MNEGIISKPGRSGAMTADGRNANEQMLLKYDGYGDPVYVTQREYREIMGLERKERSKRKDDGRLKRKKLAKQDRKRNRP